LFQSPEVGCLGFGPGTGHWHIGLWLRWLRRTRKRGAIREGREACEERQGYAHEAKRKAD
jgi:hypothetical protein